MPTQPNGRQRITAMLSESRLPASFWGECISSMVHVWNMLPTASLSGTTPFQAFYKRKPDVSHLRVWGCTSYVHAIRLATKAGNSTTQSQSEP
ncbi:hypothetical protein AGABI1DRAFT_134888 [Agaricus bisporus var. burnettii JB137-S8]|uniref:Integrase catalytic domain-containing protein n=1 Tax=Agaricus bisporus var. burnettii (strain JB137-S8 / ATCC MYA-4627 / FGSC 10392) TaxID=597362 RepID=K5XG63_AGABU|nr:uncharacterized protein AGABI1DRAFT_134888 [Agaricus bisporus var. burnettii JB137-S8]EKM73380.1 hypothetical protein AGABI1DRAFT_134888 [Agaricus bisporus var. burnettii JB137-S8]